MEINSHHLIWGNINQVSILKLRYPKFIQYVKSYITIKDTSKNRKFNEIFSRVSRTCLYICVFIRYSLIQVNFNWIFKIYNLLNILYFYFVIFYILRFEVEYFIGYKLNITKILRSLEQMHVISTNNESFYNYFNLRVPMFFERNN